MALSLFGDGGDLSSLFQRASAPVQAYAQPQSPPPAYAAPAPAPIGGPGAAAQQAQQYGSLSSLFPSLDLNQILNANYMQQFSNPDEGSGDRYLVTGADGQQYGINTQNAYNPTMLNDEGQAYGKYGGSIGVTHHYGTGDEGGGQYYEFSPTGSLEGARDYRNYTHNVRDAVGMSAMVLGGVAGVMGAGGAMAGEGMSGMDMAADGAAGFAPSGYGAGAMSAGPGSAGWGMDLGGAGGADGAAQAYAGAGGSGLGSTVSNALSNQAVRSGIGAAVSGLGGGGSGSGAGGLGSLIAGGYDAYAQNQASNNMLDYMKAQQAKIDGIYSPTGPLATTMYNQMSAQDAAAGRNSQYGTRTTDFLGKFGGDYAKYTSSLAQGLAGNYQQAYNQQASAGTGLATSAGKFLNSPAGQGIVQNVGSFLGNTPGSQMSSGNSDTWAQGWSNALRTGQNGSGDNIYG